MQLALTKPNKHDVFSSSRMAATKRKQRWLPGLGTYFPLLHQMVFFLCIVISSDRSPLKRAVNDFCWFVCTLRYLRFLCLTSVITLVESLTTVQSIENRGYMKGTDHYLFEGGGGRIGWFPKKKSYTAKTAESKIVQGEPWGQNRTSAFHFSMLKKILAQAIAYPQIIMHNLKVRKKNMLLKIVHPLPSPLQQIWSVPFFEVLR